MCRRHLRGRHIAAGHAPDHSSDKQTCPVSVIRVEQVKRASLADQTALLLLERVRAGEWALGARLPGETTLGPQLGVGRSTVREAIRQLAGQGVLETRQGLGVFVRALEPRTDWDSVLRQADIVHVVESRIAIEVEAAALAADRRTPTDLEAIDHALAARALDTQSVEEFVAADMAFHRSVVAAAHNDVLLDLFDGFAARVRAAMIDMLHLRPGVRVNCDGDPASSDHEAHAAIAQAVAARAGEEAARRSREHLLSLKESLS